MFSDRLPSHAEINELSRMLARLRNEGTPILDLTDSNPTRVGFDYPPNLLDDLRAPEGLRYDPQPLGLQTAREAVARDYGRRGARVDPAQVVLAASTSEAYSWIFKLLCNPGDAVLVPQPSYPLFEHLARLEAVRTVPYPIRYHGRWEIDIEAIAAAPAEVRAVLVVSPNNPTGSFVTRTEAARLAQVCRDRGWAIVADEVFADYVLEAAAPTTECALDLDVLSFTLGGASKSLGLPQVKLGWMVVGGPRSLRDGALAALEIIADTFLSIGTPVQVAAPQLFSLGGRVRQQIHRRLILNLRQAKAIVARFPSCSALVVEGGWSLVLRVPATSAEETIVLRVLDREHVLVHPGYFFDFPHDAFLVVSLLPREELFADGLARALQCVCSAPLRF